MPPNEARRNPRVITPTGQPENTYGCTQCVVFVMFRPAIAFANPHI
jgi:hypothetical protein